MKRLEREKKRMTKNHFNSESSEQKRKEKEKKKWKEGREYNLMRKPIIKPNPVEQARQIIVTECVSLEAAIF